MITRSDWKPKWGVDMKPTAIIACIGCQVGIELAAHGYRIDHVGIVTPRVYCPQCKANNGETRLADWPPPIDFYSCEMP